MAKTYKAADGSTYSLRLGGRRGEALHKFWAGESTAQDTLSAMRGIKPPAATPEDARHAAHVAANVAQHRVEPTPEGFTVVSGRSGQTYLVVPLATGGATCNCEAGRRAILASRCSHVRAVEAFAAKVLDKGGKE